MSILHKILHKVDHPLHYKLPQFAKPIRITWHTAQQHDKTFALARYNTYQFSLCFTYPNTRLPNELVLAVKQDCVIDLVKKNYVINNYY